LDYFLDTKSFKLPTLKEMGFEKTDLEIPPMQYKTSVVKNYTEQRNFPALNATTHLSVHLRFGTISARTLALETQSLNATFFNELIWRDFYHMILWQFPQIAEGKSFKPKYDFIEWRNNEKEFKAWCEGRTGYPIVDAGMRELNTTGFMHNRVRMIVASFLTKHLLIDWRWGEAYFAQKLLDFDLAANNGGWQWASGSGCDAAPYFRVFNPRLQTEKFDKELKYIRHWVPELDSFDYPKPIVVHEEARERVLAAYAKALKE
jgi:deoxyribodipyrimidine photo-lyase